MSDTEPVERTRPRAIRVLVTAERVVSVGLLALVLGLMAAQVIARYVFAAPIFWSEELARFALIWLAFVAATFVMADGRHIAVDLITRPMPPRGRVAVEVVSSLIVIATCVLLLPAGWEFVQQMAAVRSPGVGMPMNIWYMAVFVGLALLIVHAVVNIVSALRTGTPVWDRPLEDEEALPEGGG